MRLVDIYSFNHGSEIIWTRFPDEFREVQHAIDVVECRLLHIVDKGPTCSRRYSSQTLRKALSRAFETQGWSQYSIPCLYSTDYYVNDYHPPEPLPNASREMDFTKNRVGISISFPKYGPGLLYDICAKMTIFHNCDVIDVGIEIVPIKAFANEMSTGVSYFEQIVWDLKKRGVADIDIPVLILGISHT